MSEGIALIQTENKSKNYLVLFFLFIYFWVIIFFFTLLLGSVVIILYPFTFIYDRNRHSLHYVSYAWAKILTTLYPVLTYNIKGKENLAEPGQAAVYVANHLSQTDVVALVILNTRFRWLAKASLFKIPFLGWAMGFIGYIPVERGSRESSKKCLRKCRQCLDKGIPVVFFPEETRSPNGVIRQFKHGAFHLAVDAGVPVIPITIVGTNNLLKKGSILPQPAIVDIVVHPAITYTRPEPSTAPSSNLESKPPQNYRAIGAELAEKSRKAIMSALPPEQCDYSNNK